MNPGVIPICVLQFTELGGVVATDLAVA